MTSVYDSIVADSWKSWYAQVELQDSKKTLNDKIKQLALDLKPLSFEPYDEYFNAHINDYVIEDTESESESDLEDEFDNDKIALSSSNNVTLKLTNTNARDQCITNYPSSSSSSRSNSSSDDSDNEPLSQRLLRIKSILEEKDKKKIEGKAKTKENITSAKAKKNITDSNKAKLKVNTKEKKLKSKHKKKKQILPYDSYIEETRRRSTRLIMRNMNEPKRIHLLGRKSKVINGPILPERKVMTVRRPFRKSDWMLRHKDRYVAEADVPIMPVNQYISLEALLSTSQMQDVLDNFSDEEAEEQRSQEEDSAEDSNAEDNGDEQ